MPWPPPGHPLSDTHRRLRARQIAYLRSTPDPEDERTTEEVMNHLFGGLPEAED